MNEFKSAPRSGAEMPPPGLAIGIDLGTTNSLIAVVRGTPPADRLLPAAGPGQYIPDGPARLTAELLQLPQPELDGAVAEHTLFPSVVFQPEFGPRLVGMGAREAKFTQRKGRRVFYSVKRDMGKNCDPCDPAAITPELDTPVKVTAVILRAMRDAAEQKLGLSLANVPTVITIPASFQSAQRRDTLHAAISAGFSVDEHCLFDEPNAALLAYITRPRITSRWDAEETVLVFDFGGGTCDISIIDVTRSPVNGTVTLKNVGVSRYEALGGDDIDRHLAHSLLAAAFYRASGKPEREWGSGERRQSIYSQLYKIAELLKIRLCEELEKLTSARPGWTPPDFAALSVALPTQTIRTSAGPIQIEMPTLTGAEFIQVMAPFLDERSSGDTEGEHYRLTSIFTPIRDALDKSRLKPVDITRVLLAGGSSRNPLVERALQAFFKGGTVDRPDGLEFLVAEGAALQAHLKFVRKLDVLLPIAGDTIGLLTEGGKFEPLIRAGSSIPFPAEGSLDYRQFRVPREGMTHVDLVLCAGSASRPIHTVQLRFSKAVPQGAVVRLKVRFDDAKIFRLEADLPDQPGIRIAENISNPLALLPQTAEERRR
ncbi:MAG: Hsp70 family protein, partial [Thermoflexales bacterium]